MIAIAPLVLHCLLAATLDVATEADLKVALSTAQPGDVIRLGPGEFEGSLGRLKGPIHITGAGVGATWIIAPEGEDGLVVLAGSVGLEHLGIQASGPRTALKILGGDVKANHVALIGGAVGAFVDGGRLLAREVDLSGGYGLLIRSGEAQVALSRIRGTNAGVGQLGGHTELKRISVTGPGAEAGVSISGGSASLDELVIRAPGPSGLSVLGHAEVTARALDISGATEADGGYLGDCIQVRHGELTVSGATLSRCGGAAVEAMGGEQDLRAVDAAGGAAGCLVFLEGATARLEGDVCTGRGPAVVSASNSQVSAAMDRWLADPVLWVECGSGARVRLGPGEKVAEPCRTGGEPLDKPARP
jgi:hypothetical protein